MPRDRFRPLVSGLDTFLGARHPSGDTMGPVGQPVLDQMRQAEFTTPSEMVLRIAFVSAAGIALTVHTGDGLGATWAAVYLLSQALHFWFLTLCKGPERRWQVVTSHVGYAITNVVFLALPLMLLTSSDVAMVLAGAFALATLTVFVLWRRAPPRSLLPIDVGVHVLIIGVLLSHYLPHTDGMAAKVVISLAALAEITYFTMALYATTEVRHRLSDAAKRGVEAEKLQAMGHLSNGIAHDFKNILTVIRGNLELHGLVDDPAERALLIREAHLAALRASSLINQLLGFSRRAPLLPVAFDAHAVIAELAGMAARTFPPGVTVETGGTDRPMPLRADVDKLNAALLNMVLNARDAIADRAPGTGRIVITADPVEGTLVADAQRPLAPGPYIRFTVRDDGPGMTAEQRARAFEPFFTTKPIGKGSGLGLASAWEFAEQSGGTMTIRSRPGETLVALYLPATAV